MKGSDPPKRPRRLKKPIEPIHVEELLAGAGMSGFLGILDTRVFTTHLEKLVRELDTPSTKPRRDSGFPKVDGNIAGWDAQSANRVYNRALPTLPTIMPARRVSSEISIRVASAVLKVEALTELIEAATKNCYGETKRDDSPLSLDIQSEGVEETK
jgi:hypothetical protein